MIQDKPQTRKKQKHFLMGKPVCRQAFRCLLGIGSTRFQKLRRAACNNEPAPVDGRFATQKSFSRAVPSEKRQLVHDFLEEIYQTLSEPMPEASRGRGERQQQQRAPRPLQFRKQWGKRPKAAAAQARKEDQKQLRLLPPGKFSDYLNLLRARHPSMTIGLKLFNLVWATSFSGKLAIRGESQHAKCGICVRHKLILKNLAQIAKGGSYK